MTLRLIAENGRGLRGARKAAATASRPATTLARRTRELDLLRIESLEVAVQADRFLDVLAAMRRAMREGDPLVAGALLREAEAQAGCIHSRARNLGDLVARASAGGRT